MRQKLRQTVQIENFDFVVEGEYLTYTPATMLEPSEGGHIDDDYTIWLECDQSSVDVNFLDLCSLIEDNEGDVEKLIEKIISEAEKQHTSGI